MNGIYLAMLLTAALPTFDAETLDGRHVVGSLAELTSAHATFAGRERETIPTEQLLYISAQKTSAPHASEIKLAIATSEGGVIFARDFSSDAKQATITLAGGNAVVMPLANILSVHAVAAQGLDPFHNEWNRLLAENNDSDVLVVRGKNNIDYQKGVVRNVTDRVVDFEMDGDALPVKRAKVYGWIYHRHVESDLSAVLCKVADASGSIWSAKSLALADGQLRWTTPSGVAVTQPLAAVAALDFSPGKLLFLSDLKPESVAWQPFFGIGEPSAALRQFYEPRFDVNFDSKPLRLGGVAYRKGLAIRAHTQLEFRLPESYSRLQATVGMDDAVRPAGEVRLTIRGDAKTLFTATLTGQDSPRDINVALNHARRLVIVVDFAGSYGPGDYLLFGNARVLK